LRDPVRAAYLARPEARALDGLRLECAIEQWLDSARCEFDYVPSRWFFVHGLWALNASDSEGCNIPDEIGRLMKWGCRGDFTFPAGRPHCDPRFEAPYLCTPAVGPKSYDSESAEAEFAWGNRAGAAAKFFVWSSPIKASASSLDWGDRGVSKRLSDPEPLAREIIERSFRWDGVLFIKTHAHSMHRMNRNEVGRLVHPHCYGPTRDLYRTIFEGAAAADAAITLATAGEVFDRFVGATRPETIPPMSQFRPNVAGKELRFIEPTNDMVLNAAAEIDRVATAAIRNRIAEFGVDASGAERHYAMMSERGSVLPKHDLRAAHILFSLFGNRHPVHEIGAGIGVLPLLLAALGISTLGIESSLRRYEACVAVAAYVDRNWDGPLAPHSYLPGRFPHCVDGRELSDTVAVITDLSCSVTAEERRELIKGLRNYAAVLLDIDRFIDRVTAPQKRPAVLEQLHSAGLGPIFDVDISTDFALILILNDLALSHVSAARSTEPNPFLPALVELDGFDPDQGHSFRVRLPFHFPPGLPAQMDGGLVLFQDGVRLGPPRADLADIRAKGAGRYLHSQGVVYFSTRDHSDPRTKGSRLAAFHPLVGAEHAWSPDEASQGPVSGAQPELRIVLTPPYQHQGGACWLYRLGELPQADRLRKMADDATGRDRSPAILYEDGVPLGPRHAAHNRIREGGTGVYAHWKESLFFSASDNSDPNANGREYELHVPSEPHPRQPPIVP
jgi:hypothetical protein